MARLFALGNVLDGTIRKVDMPVRPVIPSGHGLQREPPADRSVPIEALNPAAGGSPVASREPACLPGRRGECCAPADGSSNTVDAAIIHYHGMVRWTPSPSLS